MGSQYEFRVAGRLSTDLVASFTPRERQIGAEETMFVCAVRDDTEFFGIIARLELLGLELIALRRVPDTDEPGDR